METSRIFGITGGQLSDLETKRLFVNSDGIFFNKKRHESQLKQAAVTQVHVIDLATLSLIQIWVDSWRLHLD